MVVRIWEILWETAWLARSGLPNWRPLAGVGPGLFEGPGGAAQRPGGDVDPLGGQAEEHDPQTLADLAEAQRVVDADVVEAHPGVRHAPHAHGRLLVGRVDAGRARRYQKGGEPGRQRRLGIGDAVGKDEVGFGAAADVLLEPVDDPRVAVADRPGLDPADVGAGGRLADGQGGGDLGGAQGRRNRSICSGVPNSSSGLDTKLPLTAR